jgi:hypothetical protein
MPKISYIPKNFSAKSFARIEQANKIIEDYVAQGFVLTLRQLYYQFVSRDLIPNTQKDYKNLGSLINDARLAGLIDWNHLEDRTRNLASLAHWDAVGDIVDACSKQFRFDKWATQPIRIEVWIEKEALAGVFEGICHELGVPFLSCRGYTSQSEMWSAGQRLLRYKKQKKQILVLHFGDHDPSGIDMTRDIRERLELFTRGEVKLDRLALNMPQIEEYGPPPNPAKDTDSRHTGYVQEFGTESWELDALEPSVLVDLVRTAVEEARDEEAWEEAVESERAARETLAAAAERWQEIEHFLEGKEIKPE